eukprot:COSAG01_NODE_60178_length_296_cov_0.695431_1_plen_26_part_01
MIDHLSHPLPPLIPASASPPPLAAAQ